MTNDRRICLHLSVLPDLPLSSLEDELYTWILAFPALDQTNPFFPSFPRTTYVLYTVTDGEEEASNSSNNNDDTSNETSNETASAVLAKRERWVISLITPFERDCSCLFSTWCLCDQKQSASLQSPGLALLSCHHMYFQHHAIPITH